MAEAGSIPVRLVRHAQASWGAADYDRLSPLGERQARHLAEWLVATDDTGYAQLVRGDLRRHAQTVAAIESAFAAVDRPLPTVRIDPGWNEFDHVPILAAYARIHADDPNLAPAAAGETAAQRGVLAAAIRAWHSGELDESVPETWQAFGIRIAAARARLSADGPVLVITSGGAMWRCAQAALDLDDAGLMRLGLSLRNTGISDFLREAERWRMLSWNELPHLAAAEHGDLHTHY